VFKKVKFLKPKEPQSYRDLALVLEKKKNKNDLIEAMKLLNEVVTGLWDNRFEDIELTSILEINHILSSCKKWFKDDNNLFNELTSIVVNKLFIYEMV
jgi:phenylalanyl-tRNA synthetase beta subunit